MQQYNQMFGSLSEFIQVKKNLKLPSNNYQSQYRRETQSQQKPNNKSTLIYYTQDKSIYLDSSIRKQKQKTTQIKAHQLIKEALEEKETKIKSQLPHWIQTKPIQKSNLKREHKLLRAIVRTTEIQSQDNTKTPFEKSFGRIYSAYSKIKTQPIDTLLPPKLAEIGRLLQREQLKPLRKKSCPAAPIKMMELQNSVRWAKKRGKKVDSFYQQLGKSVELMDKQMPGKNNYELQKEAQQKQQEEKRRSLRRKFLKQIEKRISKHTAFLM